MTTHKAKKIIKAELDKRKLPYSKLTARTISFTDLAREKCIFVKIHGWEPSKEWNDLKTVAVENGFRIEA